MAERYDFAGYPLPSHATDFAGYMQPDRYDHWPEYEEPKPMKQSTLRELLSTRFGGALKYGAHRENGECCALELLSVARGIEWTDRPERVRCWDLRELNDCHVSDEVRTKHLLPVIEAYDGSLDWSDDRQREVASRIVILTVQRIVAELPGLTDDVREQCRAARTIEQALQAARAAWAAWAAWAAASAAALAAESSAARAAGAAAMAREKVFITACQVWLDALSESTDAPGGMTPGTDGPDDAAAGSR